MSVQDEIERERELEQAIREHLECAMTAAIDRFGRVDEDYPFTYLVAQLERMKPTPTTGSIRRKERIPDSFRTKVFERDRYRCVLCGSWDGLSVDHIHPESKGGLLTMENAQTLCRSCNSRKGAS